MRDLRKDNSRLETDLEDKDKVILATFKAKFKGDPLTFRIRFRLNVSESQTLLGRNESVLLECRHVITTNIEMKDLHQWFTSSANDFIDDYVLDLGINVALITAHSPSHDIFFSSNNVIT